MNEEASMYKERFEQAPWSNQELLVASAAQIATLGSKVTLDEVAVALKSEKV